MPDPSPYNAESLKLQLGRRSGDRPQRTVYLSLPVNYDTHSLR